MSRSPSPSSLRATFGSHTFNQEVMREKLPKDTFFSLKRTLERGEKLLPETANIVAHAMKEWALEHGATHYCHWFQPMTNATAEKHDAFLSIDRDGTIVERFSGSQLIQSEPDASSFPSGGRRSTFEARGYTAWDPSSPAFLMTGPQGTTLCVPSVYMGYHGEALDEKTPLLRSADALSRSAVKMLHLLGRPSVQKVVTFVGSEQEYFLVDRKAWEKRPDLVLTGRTLLGALPPKGQQLEDHYFGTIPDRVLDYMQEVEKELYLLGIPAKTRHNEVAPHQYEIAPIHEESNLAADHNLLVMEVMRKVANRKGLALLLHEKPFAGINGSGKHNNWSMGDDEGHNLLDPGETPQSNTQFLVFLVATLKAVHRRAPLLRASIASAGNDHRLGANEAPPAIMSVFLGNQLDKILTDIERGEVTALTEPAFLHMGLSRLPAVSRDNTDRNRTSPFAFTGNKFEFRAVPSSMPISFPNTVLNTAVAEALDAMYADISGRVAAGSELNQAVLDVIKKEVTATRAVRFEGDGYSSDWQQEAARRGLPNTRTTPEALRALMERDAREMFEKYGVLSDDEVVARYQVRLEQYVKQVEIEARTTLSMINGLILPVCFRIQEELARSVNQVSAMSPMLTAETLHVQKDYVSGVVRDVSKLIERSRALEEGLSELHHGTTPEAHAHHCVETLLTRMAAVREICDHLERQIDSTRWPMPSYLDLLFHL